MSREIKKKAVSPEKKKDEEKKEVNKMAQVEQKIQVDARVDASEDSWNVVQLKRKV